MTLNTSRCQLIGWHLDAYIYRKDKRILMVGRSWGQTKNGALFIVLRKDV
nr:hypothetical protein [uncultured Peptostreptococcus sp.]